MLAYSCAISSCVHKYAFVCSVLGYPGILFGDSPDARDSVQPTAIFSKVKLNIKNQWESCRESGRSSMSICETQKKTEQNPIEFHTGFQFVFFLFCSFLVWNSGWHFHSKFFKCVQRMKCHWIFRLDFFLLFFCGRPRRMWPGLRMLSGVILISSDDDWPWILSVIFIC